MFTWGLGCLWFCVGLFAANVIWLVISWRGRRVAEREYDSSCDQISHYRESEYDRLRGLVWTHEDTIRDHKAQIADRDATIANIEAEREEAAKRILSLEDSYNEKCVEMEVYDGEFEEIKQRLSDVWRFFNLGESIITTPTFQPKRPEDQPQKPTCDN